MNEWMHTFPRSPRTSPTTTKILSLHFRTTPSFVVSKLLVTSVPCQTEPHCPQMDLLMQANCNHSRKIKTDNYSFVGEQTLPTSDLSTRFFCGETFSGIWAPLIVFSDLWNHTKFPFCSISLLGWLWSSGWRCRQVGGFIVRVCWLLFFNPDKETETEPSECVTCVRQYRVWRRGFTRVHARAAEPCSGVGFAVYRCL